jgi:hypothetical protein
MDAWEIFMATNIAAIRRACTLSLFFGAATALADHSSSGVQNAAISTTPAPKARRVFEERTLLAQRDAVYEQCASVCQQQIDEDLGRCPGAREIQHPEDSSPPLPNCKRKAVERYERCLASCPPPPAAAQG